MIKAIDRLTAGKKATSSIKTKQKDFFVFPRKCLIPHGNGPGVNSSLNLNPGRSSLFAYRLDGST
ncbi:hypothetical protein, partial [Klebsiella quasipneumoniae]|uniref:hypothetical protein n=1 Tax=Klebsiella quasipneumoniae TaxID=1463165 RepID=UPI003F6CA082